MHFTQLSRIKELNHFSMTASQESIENEIKRSNCEENIVQGCQKVVTCPKNRAQTDTCMYYNVFLKA